MRATLNTCLLMMTPLLASCMTVLSTPLPSAAQAPSTPPIEQAVISSPSGNLTFLLETEDGRLTWQADWRGETIIEPSALGLAFRSGRDLVDDFQIVSVAQSTADETWEQPWGERQYVREYHNKIIAEIEFSDGSPALSLEARVFDDGLGFRYVVPDTGAREITDELTEFRIDPEAKTWWIPAAGWNRYEELYQETP